MNLSATDSGRERGFTDAERTEIITRLQETGNAIHALSSTIDSILEELFPWDIPPVDDDGNPIRPQKRVNMVAEIHGFAIKLSQVLDGMAGNPMIAAMMPPDAAAAMMEGRS